MTEPARPMSSRSAPARTPADAPSPAPDSNIDLGLAATPVRALLRRDPVVVAPTTSIREAATLMTARRVSSLAVVEDGRLLGIVTDRDMRSRAIAEGVDTARPVVDIATKEPLTTDLGTTAFEALLLMTRRNIHHVPVLDGTRIVGVISTTDLTREHTTSAVFLAGEIYKQDTIEGLRQATSRIWDLQRALAAADATACATGHVLTAMTDALTTRLLQLAEHRFGPPPIDYVWAAAGSQGRAEQTAKSDQDNCLILDDAYDESRHGEYFRGLADFVCGGLDACGYIYCPGDMMARTAAWRQSRRQWQEYFRNWIDTPEPKALMLSSVFFDLRAIHGKAQLLAELRESVLRRTRGNSLFLAHLVVNALSRRPPLNVFGRLSPARGGPQRGKIDLKHLGVVPIVDLARIYALASGVSAVNTFDRLSAVTQGAEVSEQSARDLHDSLEFLSTTRIHHQVRQMAAGETPDNFLALRELSNFQRTQLRQAFAVVQELQTAIGQRYQAGRF